MDTYSEVKHECITFTSTDFISLWYDCFLSTSSPVASFFTNLDFLAFFYITKNQTFHVLAQVQSVREIPKADRSHFSFEIIMTNGKRKMLVSRCCVLSDTDSDKSENQPVVDLDLFVCLKAAETAALRKEWVEHLWQAMQLSSSGLLNSRDTE